MNTEQSVERPEVEIGTYLEPSFEAALEVVRREINKAREEMIARGHLGYQCIFFNVSEFSPDGRFSVYGDSGSNSDGKTLSEALSKLPKPENAKAKKIEQLKSELAALEKEAA